MDPDVIARRFPLVCRSRPPGRALRTRIAELREILRESDGAADEHTRLIRTAEVCNKAALIASDCGAAELLPSAQKRDSDPNRCLRRGLHSNSDPNGGDAVRLPDITPARGPTGVE